MNKLLKYTFMLLCCFLLMGCLPLDKETDKKSIVCTTYAQYNWLQEIIGENNSTFELTLLIKDGADLHSYQPTIQDLAKVSSADLFVYVGGESDQWVSDALKEAKNKCKPVLLEPIMKVEVVVPEEYLGNVMGDLTSRRGKPMGNESRGNALSIVAMVPLAEMFGYVTTLRSNTQGRGNFTMTFDHYEEVPKNITEEIIKKMGKN